MCGPSPPLVHTVVTSPQTLVTFRTCGGGTYLERSSVVRHGAAHPFVAAVLLDVGDPLLTLTHDLRSLQVEVFVDHLQSHDLSYHFYSRRRA